MDDGNYSDPLLRAMLDAVVLMGLDGCIALVNDATERLLGYAHNELVGQPIIRIFSDEESVARTTRMQVPKAGLELRREEAQLKAKDGTLIPVSVTGSAVLDEQGLLTGVLIVARDLRNTKWLMAELKLAKEDIEGQLDEARRQLHRLERLATLGTLAGGVGHELLNIISIQAVCVEELQAMARNGLVPEEIVNDLARVEAHITSHARQLLKLARPGNDEVTPLDLNIVANDTIKMLRGAGLLKRVEIVLDVSGEPAMILANRTRVEQVLVNLIGNAVDALQDVHWEKRHVGIRVVVETERAAVVCEVSDTGCGIAEDAIERIFDPFYTTKPPGEGTGLGLPVVRQIIEMYQGNIHVDSRVDEGTTITVTFPETTDPNDE